MPPPGRRRPAGPGEAVLGSRQLRAARGIQSCCLPRVGCSPADTTSGVSLRLEISGGDLLHILWHRSSSAGLSRWLRPREPHIYCSSLGRLSWPVHLSPPVLSSFLPWSCWRSRMTRHPCQCPCFLLGVTMTTQGMEWHPPPVAGQQYRVVHLGSSCCIRTPCSFRHYRHWRPQCRDSPGDKHGPSWQAVTALLDWHSSGCTKGGMWDRKNASGPYDSEKRLQSLPLLAGLRGRHLRWLLRHRQHQDHRRLSCIDCTSQVS